MSWLSMSPTFTWLGGTGWFMTFMSGIMICCRRAAWRGSTLFMVFARSPGPATGPPPVGRDGGADVVPTEHPAVTMPNVAAMTAYLQGTPMARPHWLKDPEPVVGKTAETLHRGCARLGLYLERYARLAP